MATIVRIETRDGVGPYRAPVDWGWDNPNGSRHPTPYEDRLLRDKWDELGVMRESWFFGFNSEQQMLEWFDEPDWLYAMRDAGLRMTVWEVWPTHVHFGERQAIFRKDKARLVLSRELVSDERYLLWEKERQ